MNMSGEPHEYLAVLKASYGYESTSEDELTIKEDQILFLIERTDEEWWKVKHKPDSIDDEATPTGLVPASYVEEAESNSIVKALYDYEAAAPGELTVTEGETLFVHEKEEDWFLVKTEREGGKVGYVPGNYVESIERAEPPENEASHIVIPDSPLHRPGSTYVDPADRVAAATDKPKADDIQTWAVAEVDKKGKKKKGTLGVGNGAVFFASESDKTPVRKWQTSAIENIKVEKSKHLYLDIGDPNPANLHFNVGSKDVADAITKKLQSSKTLTTGTSTSPPQPSSPSPPSPTPLTSGPPPPLSGAVPGTGTKPNKNGTSVHFAQSPAVIPSPDTLELDEDEGVADGEMGSALYDFAADGEDELSVREGEQLIVLDKKSSDEWWKCRNMHGDEGVVPASYIEVIGGGAEAAQEDKSDDDETHERAMREEADRVEAERVAAEAELLAAQARERAESERERKKQEAERKAKIAAAAAKAEKERRDREAQEREERAVRDRQATETRNASDAKRSGNSAKPRTNGQDDLHSSSRDPTETQPKFPNAGKTRIWHDHSGQWRTEAEFLGINKGKIRLHKINGVVIEVPPEKMSSDDVRYIESITNQKLGVPRPSRSRPKDDDDVPLGTLSSKVTRPTPPLKKAPSIDWFEFFLNAGCEIDDCTRYATSFERDKMDETILPDIKESTLRSLGLREGDIIRVMKVVEQRKAKTTSRDDALKAQSARDEEIARALQAEEDGSSFNRRPNTTSPAPNLFTGPGGTLKPRRGRPQPRGSAPPVNVDASSIASASDQIARTGSPLLGSPSADRGSPANFSVPKRVASTQPSGFDDDAWTNRPSSTKPVVPTTTASSASPVPPPSSISSQPPHANISPATQSAPSSTAPVAPAAQVPLPPSTQTTASLSSHDSGQFEILAKIGQMRPQSAPAPQPPILGHGSAAVAPPLPLTFRSGLGMGSSPLALSEHLQNQQSGMYSQHAQNAPRGPLAPVPGNQGLLNPLIPTTTGFNQFVPTRPSSNPSLQPPVQQSFQSQVQPLFLSGFGQPGPLVSQQTGFPGIIPQQTEIYSGVSSQPTGFGGSGFSGTGLPNFMPPNSFGGGQANTTAFNHDFPQPSLNNSNLGPTSIALPQKDHSPANVFAQMKSGTFGDESGPQPAEKYDSLRPQPTGILYQHNGFSTQGSYGGF